MNASCRWVIITVVPSTPKSIHGTWPPVPNGSLPNNSSAKAAIADSVTVAPRNVGGEARQACSTGPYTASSIMGKAARLPTRETRSAGFAAQLRSELRPHWPSEGQTPQRPASANGSGEGAGAGGGVGCGGSGNGSVDDGGGVDGTGGGAGGEGAGEGPVRSHVSYSVSWMQSSGRMFIRNQQGLGSNPRTTVTASQGGSAAHVALHSSKLIDSLIRSLPGTGVAPWR
mmetsp:Transcript_136510/g.340413  ORF Transcript_136510/g.340413 Transcript_136510/m.340413 type:complete len:228 (-) Transcript_136510:1217-1900(-)